MSELSLTRNQRLGLRARAHHLNPVVLLGAAGLTEAVLKEIDRALTAHELIKIRIPGDDQAERQAIAARIAESLAAARVQVIGKVLVLYRPRPPEPESGAVPHRQSKKTTTGLRQSAASPARKSMAKSPGREAKARGAAVSSPGSARRSAHASRSPSRSR